MSNVLVIYSSLNQQSGHSSSLTQEYLDTLSHQAGVTIVTRDLVAEGLDHLSGEEMAAWMLPPEQRTAEQAALAKISDDVVAQVQAADEIVVAVPMYNFGIPSILKAWLDRLARAGLTFKYTENGPVGLLNNKRVTVIATRGGIYQGTEYDTQSLYLTHFFNFVGLTDVRFVYAEGLNMGEQIAAEAISKAKQKIVELIA